MKRVITKAGFSYDRNFSPIKNQQQITADTYHIFSCFMKNVIMVHIELGRGFA
jgi:hypothetical protein